MKLSFFIVLLLLVSPLFIRGEEKKRSFVTNHVARSRGWEIVLPSGETKSAYRDFRWAIKIEKIVCNGEALKPFARNARFTPDWIAVNIDHAEFIYRSVAAEVISADRYNEALGYYEASIFRIPEDSVDVVILYRVRFPDGKESDVMKSRSFDANSRPFAGKPNDRDFVPQPGAFDLPCTKKQD